jgi:hypothetical protein
MSISNRNRLLRLRRERGSSTAAARALSVSASTVRRWLQDGVPETIKARLAQKTKRYYEPKPEPKRAERKERKERKPPKHEAPRERERRPRKPEAPLAKEIVGFERGPAFIQEMQRLRVILEREPTLREVERAVEQRPPPKREILSFHDVMERARNRGVLDYAMFQKIAQRFRVPLHDVYNVFFGYPPSVGTAA